MTKISEKTKIKEKRCTNDPLKYVPWIKVDEFMSNNGTGIVAPDYKNGREMHFLSYNEYRAYLMLRFDDNVDVIYDQKVLDLDTTNKIADQFGYRRVDDGKVHMTTDLYVIYKNGTEIAISVKDNPSFLLIKKGKRRNIREIEKQRIEMEYWKIKGVQWTIIFSADINRRIAKNIEICSYYYNPYNVYTKEDLLKYYIIHKEIILDDFDKTIEYKKIASAMITDSMLEDFLKRKKENIK